MNAERGAGRLLADCLAAQGADRAFCVPGESFLPLLDALPDAGVEVVVARQEGGAAMMAEADGKLTGRPGLCVVTRGPGATNAAAGVHVARQDSTPMLLLVGQIGRGLRGRDAFQEIDLRQTFGDLAKWADQIDDADRIPETICRAYAVAMSGRPGPVVLGLPEDMLGAAVAALPGPRVEVAEPAPDPGAVARLGALLRGAARPVLVLGGARWTDAAVAAAARFAEAWDLPTAVSFRRQGLMDHEHPCYAGDAGLGINPALAARIAGADLVILLGGRLSENPSQNYTLLSIPKPAQRLVHVHPGPEELGRVYAADLAVCATPASFLAAAAALGAGPARGRGAAAHAEYLAWSAPRLRPGAGVDLGFVVAHLGAALPADAIVTNGAGNYAGWLHRFHRFRRRDGQVAPTSGSMGYGLPAAIAAKLRLPGREVVCLAGDGCFQMTMQEFGTAAQHGVGVVTLVCDNRSYGTIRMHQERRFPGRVVGTDLANPDFAALARAYGAHAETVRADAEFPAALARSRTAAAAGAPALLHLLTDPEAITPAATLSSLRAGR